MQTEKQVLPRLSTLTAYGFYLTSAIDAGKADALSIQDVHRALDAKEFPEAPQSIGFTLADFGEEQDKALLKTLRVVAAGIRGDERRKYDLSKSGLCFLVAATLEAMQQGFWDRDSFDRTRGYGFSPFCEIDE